jgi:hypothetical protein
MGEDSFCFRFTKWRLMDRKRWRWLVCLSVKSMPKFQCQSCTLVSKQIIIIITISGDILDTTSKNKTIPVGCVLPLDKHFSSSPLPLLPYYGFLYLGKLINLRLKAHCFCYHQHITITNHT